MTAPFPPMAFWHSITRVGEAQILLPAMLAVALWLVHRAGATRLATRWLAYTAVAALVTTATKVAFIGWGIGSAPLDFTGISGHAMFAAAILPVLAGAVVTAAQPGARHAAWLAGYLLALVVTVSRVVVGAHSWSEAWGGFALGALASGVVLAEARLPRALPSRAVLAALALWLVLAPAGAPESRTHGWVVRLSLALSGHERAYTRSDLHRDAARLPPARTALHAAR